MADPILDQLRKAGSRKVLRVSHDGVTLHVRSMSGEWRAEFMRKLKAEEAVSDVWLAAVGLCGDGGEEFMVGQALTAKVAAIKDQDGALLNALARGTLEVSGLTEKAVEDAEGN